MSGKHWLVILERPLRGDIERTYADSLYQTRVFCAQFRGEMDVLVRGEAALLVCRPTETVQPDPWWGHSALEGMAPLISDGTRVLVEEESLAHGQGDRSLLPGVTTISRADMASTWASYEAIVFF